MLGPAEEMSEYQLKLNFTRVVNDTHATERGPQRWVSSNHVSLPLLNMINTRPELHYAEASFFKKKKKKKDDNQHFFKKESIEII